MEKTIILISTYDEKSVAFIRNVIVTNLGSLYIEKGPLPYNALLINRKITVDEKNRLDEILTENVQEDFGIFYIHVDREDLISDNKFYLTANAMEEH